MKKSLRFFYAALIYFLMYAPLLLTIVFSFNNSRYALTWNGFTMKWYAKMIDNSSLMNAALNSLILSCISATIASVVGTITAIALHRYAFPGKKMIFSSLYVLIMSPEIIMAISLVMMFILIGIPLGFYTILLSHVTFCLPFVAVTVLSRLQGFNKHLLEVASDLGAVEGQILKKIILPLALPAIAAGWLMSFTLSLDDVIISFFVSGPSFEILPLKIFSMVKSGVKPDVNALCAVMFGLTSTVILTCYFLVRRKK